MKYRHLKKTLSGIVLVALAATSVVLAESPTVSNSDSAAQSLIIKAATAEQAAERVEAVGGTITHRLGIINAVAAEITPAQRARLQDPAGSLRIYGNHEATLDAKGDKGGGGSGGGGTSKVTETYYPTHLGADALHLVASTARASRSLFSIPASSETAG